MAVTIALFTRDLRVHDNPVLVAAAKNGDAVLPVFVVDEAIASSNYLNPNKASFLAAALAELDDELRRRGGRLTVRHGPVVAEVERMVADLSITEVHVASDVSGYAHTREQRLRDRLAARGCRLVVHSSSVTVSSGSLPARAGCCLRRLCCLVKKWLAGPVDDYHTIHDDLAADATSRLSPYLHFGCFSPVELVYRTRSSTTGCAVFIRQLAWRDFYAHVLAARPAAAHEDYRGRDGAWRHSSAMFDAWRRGRTGYPIVDPISPPRKCTPRGNWNPMQHRTIRTASSITTGPSPPRGLVAAKPGRCPRLVAATAAAELSAQVTIWMTPKLW